MPEELIGKVTHYFNKIGVAVVKVDKGELAVGDTVHFKHGDRDFEQTVGSLEIDRKPVEKIGAGEEAGMKVNEPVKEGDKMYKVIE